LWDGNFCFRPNTLIHFKNVTLRERSPRPKSLVLSASEILRFAQDDISEDRFKKGEQMNPSSQPNELQEVSLQEADIKNLNDDSLPAAEVIADQSQDTQAKELLAPRFIP
jgi:hypothetical protein